MNLNWDGFTNLSVSERRFDIHLYADLAEILCLACPDHTLSRSAFQNWLYTGDFYSSPEGELVDALDPGDEANDEEDVHIEVTTRNLIDRDSRREAFINNIFEHLLSRYLSLNANVYPFVIDDNAMELRLSPTQKQSYYLYKYLLLCSHLNIFPKAQPQLTSLFETVAYNPFSKLLPPQNKCKAFGVSNSHVEAYTGSAFNKLQALCRDMCVELRVSISGIPATSSGDYGLDYVGWLDIDDGENRRPVYLGQCACGRDWKDKQGEIAIEKWRNCIETGINIMPVMIIPYYMRDHASRWFEKEQIYTILVDRLRFLHLLTEPEISNMISDEYKGEMDAFLAQPCVVL